MEIVVGLGCLLASYILGSIPFGLVFVRLLTGKDLRQVESGRTGGTNAGRAAGLGAGIATAVLDFLKGAAAVWMARLVLPGSLWLEILAPVAAILGHNCSVFLIERNAEGKLRFRGGAGGAPTAGGAFALWPISILIILPVGAIILFGIGYASLTTLSIALITIFVFAFRALQGLSPWLYVVYGLIAEALLVIALVPNIRRLLNGTERIVGLRARHKEAR